MKNKEYEIEDIAASVAGVRNLTTLVADNLTNRNDHETAIALYAINEITKSIEDRLYKIFDDLRMGGG